VLNNVFYSSTFWGAAHPADTNLNYAAVISQGSNNLSDQPNEFKFDWAALTAATTDLTTLDANVFNQSSGDSFGFSSAQAPEGTAVQNVSSLLCDISLMGTVWYNHSAAILNPQEFLTPLVTISSIVETLSTANASVLKEIRDDLFVQAYNKYKYDVSYQKLALQDGDSFSIPVRFVVSQEVNYDLSGSPKGGHANNMLTFVVGTNEYAVMKQESSSNELVYLLSFVAVGARDNEHA
jgi:hypothetical protein